MMLIESLATGFVRFILQQLRDPDMRGNKGKITLAINTGLLILAIFITTLSAVTLFNEPKFPEQSDLVAVSGLPTQIDKNSETSEVSFQTSGSEKKLLYPDWYPASDDFRNSVNRNTQITVFINPNDESAEYSYIWQVGRNEQSPYTYQNILGAHEKQRRTTYFFIGVCVFAVVFFAYHQCFFWSKYKKANVRYSLTDEYARL